MPAVPTPIDAALADLDAAERGFVLGVLVAQGAQHCVGADDAAAALATPARERCAAATRAIAALPRAERVRLMGLLAREALEPVPAGIENVHPDTLRGLLRAESIQTIRLVTANGPPVLRAAGVAELAARTAAKDEDVEGAIGAPAAPDVIADLQRAVLAPIVAVPPVAPGAEPNRWGCRMATLAPAALVIEVTATGADVLGASLRGADGDTLKRAAAHVGSPWSERIVNAARSDLEPVKGSEDRAGTSRAHARTLVATTTPAEQPRRTLERLGARAFGDRLAQEDPDLAQALAQRLPSDLGRELLAAAGLTPTYESD